MKDAFAARLRAGEQLSGPLLRMPNETLVELTGAVGMDLVVIDTEHGPADQIPLIGHLIAAQAAGLGTLVRVGSNTEILRVLDSGADGIIAPHISSVEQARALVRACHYPPRGERGFATYIRAGRFGLYTAAEHLRRATASVVVVMIEDADGVAAAAGIAAVDGVDGVFVGPADLAIALGHPGDLAHPDVTAAIATVHAAARAAGKSVSGICSDVAGAHRLFASGATVVLFNAMAALGVMFTSLASAARNASDPAPENVPIVLLPGMLATEALWDRVAARFGPQRSVSALRIDFDDTITGMAESVLAQAPPRFSLAGHSLGGIVALEVALCAPQRVSRLAVVNASGRAPSDAQLERWSTQAERVRAGNFAEVLEEEITTNLGPATTRGDLGVELRAMGRQVGAAGLLRELAAQAGRADVLAALRDLAVPTLVISGVDDEVCPPERQAELVAALPDARAVHLSGSGHLSPLDAAEEIAGTLADFL